MASKHRIFDHHARYMTELEADSTPRSWVLNGFGQWETVLDQSYLSGKFSPREESIVQYGNFIHIRHIPSKEADGTLKGQLPDWAGIILPPRGWPVGRVRVNAYSMEGVLSFRPMLGKKVKGTPKSIFMQIIQHANEVPAILGIGNNLPFQFGHLDDLPIQLSDKLVTTAYNHIQTLCKNSGMDWDVTTEVDGKGNLHAFANLYARKGVNTNFILGNLNTERDANTELMIEQGTPYNVIPGYSEASTDADRIGPLLGINQTALDDYGPLIASSVVFMGMRDASSVGNAAQMRADGLGRPSKIIPKRKVLDYGDTFSHLDTGNIVTIRDTDAGFAPGGGYGTQSTARITSVDYSDLSNNAPTNWEVV